MSASAEVCEDLSGKICVEVPIEVSEAFPLDWEPTIVGVALSITYVGNDGIEYIHHFEPNKKTIALLCDIDDGNLTEETATQVGNAAALLMADPSDDFIVINNVTLTNMGLEDKN